MAAINVTDMAKGAEAAMQVETARPRALVDVAQQQATLEQTQQQNLVRGYQIDERLADTAGTPESSSSRLGEVFGAKNKIRAIEDTIKGLTAKRDSIKFDDVLYERHNARLVEAQKELKDLKAEQAKVYQDEVLRASSPILAATDQESWNRARPLYARSQVEAMKQLALDSGKPEPTPQELEAAYQSVLQSIPEKYGPSAENMKRAKGIEISKLKDVLDIEQEERAQAKAKLDEEATRLANQKAKVELDKAQKDSKVNTTAISTLSNVTRDQTLNLEKMTKEEQDILARLTVLDEKASGLWDSRTEEEVTLSTELTKRLEAISIDKAAAEKVRTEAQKGLSLAINIAEAKSEKTGEPVEFETPAALIAAVRASNPTTEGVSDEDVLAISLQQGNVRLKAGVPATPVRKGPTASGQIKDKRE